MDLFIYDQNFKLQNVVDSYESLIWTERYNSCGDFQLDALYSDELYSMLTNGDSLTRNYYARLKDSDTIMLIEDVTIKTDAEEGAHLTVIGRSLESILDRRIIYNQLTLTGKLQNGIKTILEKNAINPTDSARVIPGLVFQDSSDPAVTGIDIDTQYHGDNVYAVIEELCKSNFIGFRLTRPQTNLVFELYSGTNRTYDQTATPFVIFSDRYDNLINSNYHESSQVLKSVAIIASEYEETVGEKKVSHLVTVEQQASDAETPTGLYRRELFVDGTSVSQKNDDKESTDMTEEEYKAALKGKGKEDLVDYIYQKEFDAEIESRMQFIYGRDYFIGDVVEIENEYGIASKARVIEFIRSQDTTGYSEYPTFENVE